MIVESPHPAEIRYILRNLRDKSREELDALGVAPETAARDMIGAAHKWVIYDGALPAAVIGMMDKGDGTFAGFGLGTDGWRRVWRLVTLVAKRDMFEMADRAGWKMIYALSPSWHEDTHKWLRFIGSGRATRELPLAAFGPNRRDFIMFQIGRHDDVFRQP